MQSQRKHTFVDVPNSFEEFRKACAQAFVVELLTHGKQFKIYLFPSFHVNELSDRRRITADNYVELFTQWRRDSPTEPFIYIWSERPEGNSPDAGFFERKDGSDRGRPPSLRGYSTTDFRRNIKDAYGHRCLACGGDYKNAEGSLEVCHILELREITNVGVDEQNALLRKCDLTGVNDDHNFILLCKACHKQFDDQLLGIKGDGENYQWLVKPELEQTSLPHSQGTYGDLAGTQIQFMFGPPMPKAIAHRYERYLKGIPTKKRKVNRMQPYACTVKRAASYHLLLRSFAGGSVE